MKEWGFERPERPEKSGGKPPEEEYAEKMVRLITRKPPEEELARMAGFTPSTGRELLNSKPGKTMGAQEGKKYSGGGREKLSQGFIKHWEKVGGEGKRSRRVVEEGCVLALPSELREFYRFSLISSGETMGELLEKVRGVGGVVGGIAKRLMERLTSLLKLEWNEKSGIKASEFLKSFNEVLWGGSGNVPGLLRRGIPTPPEIAKGIERLVEELGSAKKVASLFAKVGVKTDEAVVLAMAGRLGFALEQWNRLKEKLKIEEDKISVEFVQRERISVKVENVRLGKGEIKVEFGRSSKGEEKVYIIEGWEKLYDIISESNLSIMDLGREIGVNHTILSRALRVVSVEKVDAAAKILGLESPVKISIDELALRLAVKLTPPIVPIRKGVITVFNSRIAVRDFRAKRIATPEGVIKTDIHLMKRYNSPLLKEVALDIVKKLGGKAEKYPVIFRKVGIYSLGGFMLKIGSIKDEKGYTREVKGGGVAGIDAVALAVLVADTLGLKKAKQFLESLRPGEIILKDRFRVAAEKELEKVAYNPLEFVEACMKLFDVKGNVKEVALGIGMIEGFASSDASVIGSFSHGSLTRIEEAELSVWAIKTVFGTSVRISQRGDGRYYVDVRIPRLLLDVTGYKGERKVKSGETVPRKLFERVNKWLKKGKEIKLRESEKRRVDVAILEAGGLISAMVMGDGNVNVKEFIVKVEQRMVVGDTRGKGVVREFGEKLEGILRKLTGKETPEEIIRELHRKKIIEEFVSPSGYVEWLLKFGKLKKMCEERGLKEEFRKLTEVMIWHPGLGRTKIIAKRLLKALVNRFNIRRPKIRVELQHGRFILNVKSDRIIVKKTAKLMFRGWSAALLLLPFLKGSKGFELAKAVMHRIAGHVIELSPKESKLLVSWVQDNHKKLEREGRLNSVKGILYVHLPPTMMRDVELRIPEWENNEIKEEVKSSVREFMSGKKFKDRETVEDLLERAEINLEKLEPLPHTVEVYNWRSDGKISGSEWCRVYYAPDPRPLYNGMRKLEKDFLEDRI